jgi:hypothetical protein
MNIFYTASGNPGTLTDGLSAIIRGEFLAIQTAFDMMPQISTTGVFNTIFAQTGNFTFTLPAGPGTLAMLSDVAAAVSVESGRALAAEGINTTAIGANATVIGAEVTARTNADAGEVTARNAAIAAETAARVVAVAAEAAARVAADAFPTPGFLSGLSLSNDVGVANAVIDIAAGSCADSTNTVKITLGTFTKNISGAWAAGTGANGMGTGLTATLSTWYHVYAATIGGLPDVFFDTASPPTHAPAGTTASRRIGSFKINAAGNITPFVQNGDRFDWSVPVLEYNGTPGVTTALTLSLAGVPTGIAVQALLFGSLLNTIATIIYYVSSLAQADVAASGSASTAVGPVNTFSSFAVSVETNASGQIRHRTNGGATAITVTTNGWIDTRGRG